MTRYILTWACSLLFIVCSALAEEAAPAVPLDFPKGDAAPAVPQIPCTLAQVLYTAVLNNSSLEIARLNPEIADTAVPEARGAFDPSLGLSMTKDETHAISIDPNTTAASIPTGFGDLADSLVALDRLLNQYQGPQESVVANHHVDTTLSLQQAFTTGTRIGLNGGIGGLTNGATGDLFQSDLNLSLRQPLLRGFGRRIGTIVIRQAQNQAQQSRAAFFGTVLSTLQQVESAYWDLVLAHELLKIREFGVTLSQEQFDRSDVRYKVGKGIQADVLAAQAELATRKADLSDAHAEIRARSLALLQLIKPAGRGAWQLELLPEAAPEVPADTLDAEASVALALEKRPELRQADLEVERLGLDVRLRKNDMLPNVDLVATYGRNGAGASFGGSAGELGSSRLDQYSVGVEFQTSLTKRSERARLQRAKLSAEQAERSLRRTQDSVEGQVRQAVISAQKLRQRIDANQQAVTARKEELSIEQGRNQVGKTTTLDVLQVQRDLLQSQTDEATTRIGYLQSLAGLYTVEGTLLEQHGIAFEAAAE